MKKILMLIFLTVVAASLSAGREKSGDDPDFQSKSFTVQQGGLLTVDVDPGAVRIETWSKNEVSVEAIGIDERYPDRLLISQSGNNVSVKYNERGHRNSNIKFDIKVPSNFNANIETSGGSIKQKSTLTGNFKAETQGGSIDIDHIIGKVEAETGGGSIKAEKIEGDGKMETGGGSIKIGLVTGVFNVKTGGGSIVLGESGEKVIATTGGGSIKAENAKEWIELVTGGGSVTVRNAKFGAKVKTGGGSVEMENVTGAVDVATGGGSIQCELNPGSKGNSKIRTGGGEIELSLPENAKAVIEATINNNNGWGKRREKHRISSDFKADKYESKEDGGNIYAIYTINGGGPTIYLETSDSDIRINKTAGK